MGNETPNAVRVVASWIGTVVLLGLLSGCSRLEKSWAEAKAMPRVSEGRAVGTPAYPGDPADVRRSAAHPMFPTGGWNALALHNPERTRPLGENFLTHHESLVAGYVRFERSGTLRIRSYDDVYGAVYGGWSPASLRLAAGADYQFVGLGKLSVGDGGLAQIHEVVWFGDGQDRGTIVWSSAYSGRGKAEPPVGPADLFRESELGDRRFFNRRLAKYVIADLLGRRELAEAERITELAIRLWAEQPEMVTASREPIPNRIGRRDELAYLLLIKLGLQAGQPAAAQTAREIASLVDGPRQQDRFTVGRYRTHLPLYRWLAEPPGPGLEKLPGPDPNRGEPDVEAAGIVKFLGTPETRTPKRNSSYELFVRSGLNVFWVGARARLEGREAEARSLLSNYLKTRSREPLESQPFELALAARWLGPAATRP